MKRNCISGRIPPVAKERNCCPPRGRIDNIDAAECCKSDPTDALTHRLKVTAIVLLAAIVLGLAAACMGADKAILPTRPDGTYPPVGTPDEFTPYPVYSGGKVVGYRNPTYPVAVWFDPQLRTIRDTTGTPLIDRHKEALAQYCCVCGIIWWEVDDPNRANFRFHYRDRDAIVPLSLAWQDGYGTGCWAVSPDHRDIYTSDRLKPAQGSKRIGKTNAIRFPQRALAYVLLGATSNLAAPWDMKTYGYRYDQWGWVEYAAGNPNMGSDPRYPATQAGVLRYGYAGFGPPEINSLASRFGPAWIYRVDASEVRR